MVVGCRLERDAEGCERLVAEGTTDELHADRKAARRPSRRNAQHGEAEVVHRPHEPRQRNDRRFGARPGWYFLTGKQENVDFALQKLGQHVEQREAHSNLLIVGNERTGLWKKVFGLSKPEEILTIVKGVLDDRGAPPPGR